MTFGQKLQQLRKSRGLSQEDLAGNFSVTRQTISKWELDQSTPDLPYLAAISEFFGVSTDYLIKEQPADPIHNMKNTDFDAPPKKPQRSMRYILIRLFMISLGGIVFPMLILTIAVIIQADIPHLAESCFLIFILSTIMAIICGLLAIISPRQS